MPTNSVYERAAWTDRFNAPSVKALRQGLPAPARPLFDRVHRCMTGLDGVEETFSWYGEGWNWTIEYRTKHCDDPLAVIIPAPTDLQLAVPMDLDFSRSLPVKRMKRAVRDGLELAQEPFDTRWAVWSLIANGLVEDLEGLVEQKLKHAMSA